MLESYRYNGGMEVEHRDKNLRRLEEDPAFDAGYSQGIVRTIRRRLQLIRAAADERDFYSLKSLHFEQLKGNRSHQHSMCINDQWRLIIEFEGKGTDKKIILVGVDDYH